MQRTKKRLFVAIEPSEPLRAELARRILELKKSYGEPRFRISWVKPENVHLTLRFLGPVDPEGIPAICEELKKIASSHLSFESPLGGLRTFLSNTKKLAAPFPLWVGPTDPVSIKNFQELFEKLEASFISLGFAKEDRPFVPHLTIARVKGLPRTEISTFQKPSLNEENTSAPLEVKALVLFESVPSSSNSGSIYQKIFEAGLKFQKCKDSDGDSRGTKTRTQGRSR